MGSLEINLGLFMAGVSAVAFIGPRLTHNAAALAEKTGWGQAVMGAVFIGAVTSLSGSFTSLVSAAKGHPHMAVSNAVGGIGAQMTFLAFADILYRRVNLEHAAASESNLMQTAFLGLMLVLPLSAMLAPPAAWHGIHPISVVMVAVYGYGIQMIFKSHKRPMWFPRQTNETVPDKENENKKETPPAARLWFHFSWMVFAVSSAGWILAKSGLAMAKEAGISETVMGGIFTAVSTSLPELIVAVSAVRQGALTLAVGDVVGGNVFDTLIVAGSDFFYRDGSIYHAVGSDQGFIFALSLILTSILMVGLLRREKHGVANIGLESLLMPVVYVLGFGWIVFR